MSPRATLWFYFIAALVARGAEINLPLRRPDAIAGREFASRIAPLYLAERETAILAEVQHGNVPDFWRRFVDVKLADNTFLSVAPDYLAVGSDEDYFFTPLSPTTAQALADQLDCVLPTTKIVAAIHHAAPLKLNPAPIPPSDAMTSVPSFLQHNATVRAQREAALAAYPPGTLIAGDKKDIVLTPQLADAPGKIAIYGWHKPDGTVIQPLFLGHAAGWVDYSHGVRLVRRAMTLHGMPTTIDAVLADPKTCALLSDEGPLRDYRYGTVCMELVDFPGEKNVELHLDGGIRVVVNSPSKLNPAKPTRLVLYALPAGNSIEQTIGRRLRPGDDWHFDIQHIGAQTRWVRDHTSDANLIVAYLQCNERSFALWRHAHADSPARLVAIVDALRGNFPRARLVLASHSAGGGFTFGYLDGLETVPDDIERIAFLDSDYAYDANKNHGTKLAQWLASSGEHRLCVLAYEDYLALLDGKTFISEAGGTWGRSEALLHDLGEKFPFTRADQAGLQTHTALDGRAKFFLKENPAKAILHTRQVEWNGFIHALLTGTPCESRGYVYLGPRVYEDQIAPD